MSLYPYSYAILRAVPRVERGEFVNVGVIIYCQQLDFLRAAAAIDPDRIRALDHGADIATIERAVDAVLAACEQSTGSNRENSGLVTRFGMLTAPRSTVVQPSPVHVGLTSDPQATLEQLIDRLVRAPR
ncbi:DUF3037 domain-containing protein [Microlunatus soli]|uniref:DUF3037 domain-containing protein n=1 Tax=Microlunatus soli TaxID=630515 RepID=A0A1H1YB15_9ACTN|nr:DUF3037 domain-containing protein [Microlunatus soli]SDT18617.1 Protein of unknown function [Microlunatus soli]